MDTNELKSYILRQLGSPKLNVELTGEQLQDAIDDAIYELQPWLGVRRYVTVPNSQCIDLTEYKVSNVTDVREVLSGNSKGSGNSSDNLSLNGNMFTQGLIPRSANLGLTLTPYNTNIHTYATNYSRARRENLYSNLAEMVQSRINDTLGPSKSFEFINNKLYTNCSTPYITIEFDLKVDKPEDLEGDDIKIKKYTKYLKDLSVAFSRLMQSRLTGKYKDNNAQVQVDSDRIEKGAQQEIDRIREEIRSQSDKFFIS